MPENVLFTFMGHPDKQDVNVAQQKDDPQPVMAGSAAAGGYETQQQDDLVLAAPDVSVLGTVGVADG